MINRVKAFSRAHALEWKNERRGSVIGNWLDGSPWALISIVDSWEPVVWEPRPEVLTLRFDPSADCGIILANDERLHPLSSHDAGRVVTFVRKFHELPESIALIVHCRAGSSRSGAVAEYVLHGCERNLEVQLGVNKVFEKDNPRTNPDPVAYAQLWAAHRAAKEKEAQRG